ncbi:diguanylate cyclase (GGDEF) domain-containing protein [Atopomonas hussainii]|uniref:diguanylate cyclase n=1 Tax=Atopomonas hussainii TaxID=1429083 RepID=A0A1H7GWU6_9GAMM|nr:GGDEF domain-containing protein [Atopomonas hussainii]SEK41522.1 diguanylate cyclase (GGDEF) domain-containing protein [Atopomonas hussainii]
MLTPFQAQRLRIQRIWLASLGSSCYIALCWLAFYFDHLELTWLGMLALTLFVALCCGGFMLLVRTRINLRFSDPSMTQAQMIVSILTIFTTAAFARDFRFLLMVSAVMVLLFGVFRLSPLGILRIALLMVVAFAAVSGWRLQNLEPSLWATEFEQGVAFVLLVFWVALMGGEISRQQTRLNAEVHDLRSQLLMAQQQVMIDPLTGLYNRRQANRYLDQLQAMMARGGQSAVLALVDIQQLAKVNAQYGEEEGDEALRSVAKLLRTVLRDVDFVARLGGDEFLLVLNYTDLPGAQVVAERLADKIAGYRFGATGQIRLNVRVGLTLAKRGETWEETLKRSGDALHLAKDSQQRVVQV